MSSDYLTYTKRVADALAGVDAQAFARFVEVLRLARERGATVYTAGNGGSLAVASHFAGDALKACRLRAVCLSDNATALTAFSNDAAYHESIAGPLKVLANAGDVLVLFSCSGTSANIWRASRVALERGVLVCAVFGDSDGARTHAEELNAAVIVPSGDYGAIEDSMSVICHAAIRELGA